MSKFQQPYGYNKDAPESVPWIKVPRLSKWKSIKASFAGLKIETRQFANAILPSIVAPTRVHQYSKAIEKATIRNPNIRRVLDHPIELIKLRFMAQNHTHRDAAQLRTSVNILMSDVVKNAGYTPYTVSMSASDTGLGARFFYTAKDLSIPFRNDSIPDDAVLLFTDVDYYADMNKWLKLFKPIILYTLVPETAAYHGTDYTYHIKDDEVCFRVSGGATYQHKIWDYTGDTICIEGKHRALLTFHVTQHKIDKDPNRRIITLIPAAIVAYPHYCHLRYDNGLKRRKFCFDDKNILYEPIGDKISVSANGSPHSVELSGMSYEAIRSRLSNKTSPPVISDVERILAQDNVDKSHVKAPVLFNLIGNIKYVPNVMPTNLLPTHFQPIKPLATEDGVNPGKPFSNPLTEQPSLFAARSFNADHATINGRVNKMRNIVRDPPVKYKKYLDEFVDLLVPEPAIGSPWSVDQVRRAQNAPTQVARARLAEASLSIKSKNRLAAFIKAEPYVSTNDPRNITTCSPEHTIGMSSFTLPFKREVLKKHHWYGPSKTPKQICKRLSAVCKDGAVLSDYERLDGSMSEFMHLPYKRAILRWLKPEFRSEYLHWHRECFIRKAATSTGVKYDAGNGTRSGSAITTDTNTCGCSYVCYCALRDIGYTPAEAWEQIGIICGDDGVNNNLFGLKGAMENCAKDLGLKLVCELVGRNCPIKYCSRIFIDPLTMPDSFQDPKRTIPKLHLTSNKNVTDMQAAVNKASGYIVTDSKTPIVGDWCRKIQSLTNICPVNLTHEELFKCTMPWPQTNVDAIREEFCKCLNITGAELHQAVELINQVNAIDNFPTILDIPFVNKLVAQVGSEIVGPIVRKSEELITNSVVSVNDQSQLDSVITIAEIHPIPQPIPLPRKIHNLQFIAKKPVPLPRSKILHSHRCKSCKQQYWHKHPLKSVDHPQFDFQCANENCRDYYGNHPTDKSNSTESSLERSKCLETSVKPTRNKSRKRTNDGETRVPNTSSHKSESKRRKRKHSKPKVVQLSSGILSTSIPPSKK